MLHALTLLPLVAPPAPAQADALLSVVPQDAVFCLHAHDPRSLIALRDSSDVMAFALDARWETVIGDIAPIFMDGEEDVAGLLQEFSQARTMIIEAAADCTGAVMFAGMPADENSSPTIGFVARAGDRLAELLAPTVGEDATRVTLQPGIEALVGEAGRTELFVRHQGYVMAFSAPTIEGAKELARTSLARLENTEPSGPFAKPGIAPLRGGNAMEFAMDLGPIWDAAFAEGELPNEGPMAELAQGLRAMDWVYGSFSLGEGEHSTWEIRMPYGEESMLGGFLGFMGEADTNLLREVPESAVSAGVFSFDVAGAVDWGLGLVERFDETAHSQAMGALEGASGMIGFDLMDDVIRNFTGDFVAFNQATGMRSGGIVVPGDAPSFVAHLRDSEVMLDVMDTLLDMSGMSAATTSEDMELAGGRGEMEIVSTTEDAPMSAEMGIGAGRMIISLSAEPGTVRSYGETVAGGEETSHFLSSAALARAARDARGSMVQVQLTAAAATSIENMARTMKDLFGGLDELDQDFGEDEPSGADTISGLIDAADRVSAMIRQYFEGTTTSELRARGGLIEMSIRTR